MKNNGNGSTMGELMTYDDLLRHLQRDRQETISILVESAVETYVDTDGLIESLQKIYNYNNIPKNPEYYLQDESVLYQDLLDFVYETYNMMSNEEIIEYYKENAPFVFDPVNYLQQLFDK